MQGELYLAKSGRRRLDSAPLPADLRAATEDASPYSRLGAVAELRSRLLSENLPVAAGAHEALARMASQDTQLVAAAATEALRALALTATPKSLDFGQVPVGMRSGPQEITLAGPPLARHVTVAPSKPWIRCQGGSATYEVYVTPQSAEELNGSVTFHGVAVEATVTVRVDGYFASSSRPDIPGEPLSERGRQSHVPSLPLGAAAMEVARDGPRDSAESKVPAVPVDVTVDSTADVSPQHSDEGIGLPGNGDALAPTQGAPSPTDSPSAASSTAHTARTTAPETAEQSVGKRIDYPKWGLLVGVILFFIGGSTNVEILLTVGFLLFVGCSVALLVSAVRNLINRRKGRPTS
jgi:hypothetical protein